VLFRSELHPSTVGDILRNRKECYASVETKKRVMRLAKTMNYRRNMSAVALKTSRSNLIGLIGNFSWEPHLAHLATSLSEEFLKRELGLEIHVPGDSSVEDGLRAAYARPADAIVNVANYSPSDGSFVSHLLEVGYPLISVLCNKDIEGDYITIDRFKAMHDIVEYLVGLGHRRIGCCTWRGPSDEKEQGFLHAANALGVEVSDNCLFHVPGTFKDGYKFGNQISLGPDNPTVYVMHNDVAAMGFIRAMADRNIRVPDDVGVVGFNGDEAGCYSNPRLTTVKIPLERIVRETVELVFKKVKTNLQAQKNSTHRRVVIPAELIIRDSVKAI